MTLSSRSTGGISLRRDGAVVSVTLENPEVRNRISTDNIQFLREAWSDINRDTSIRVLLLTGVGKCFCAGFDLNALSGIASELNENKTAGAAMDTEVLAFEALADELEQLRCPTVCALNGSAYGGGVDLALACDFRIGVEDLKVMVPAAKIGLHYPANGIQRFVRKLGANTAKRLLLGTEFLSGQQLVDCGFVEHLVSGENLAIEAANMAGHIAGLAPLAVESMKFAINHFSGAIASVGNNNEQSIKGNHLRCLQSADFFAGVESLQSGEAPSFKRE